jgi:hypothetical protein
MLRVVGNGTSHPVYCRDVLCQVGTVLRLAHCLQRFHILWAETYSILGDLSSTTSHRGCKPHALAGVQLQFIILTLLEQEAESCEQVIFSLRMK